MCGNKWWLDVKSFYVLWWSNSSPVVSDRRCRFPSRSLNTHFWKLLLLLKLISLLTHWKTHFIQKKAIIKHTKHHSHLWVAWTKSLILTDEPSKILVSGCSSPPSCPGLLCPVITTVGVLQTGLHQSRRLCPSSLCTWLVLAPLHRPECLQQDVVIYMFLCPTHIFVHILTLLRLKTTARYLIPAAAFFLFYFSGWM